MRFPEIGLFKIRLMVNLFRTPTQPVAYIDPVDHEDHEPGCRSPSVFPSEIRENNNGHSGDNHDLDKDPAGFCPDGELFIRPVNT